MIGGRAAGYLLLGLAGVLFVVAALSAWSGAQRIGGREDDSRAVSEAANAFVLAYGTFDYREQGAYLDRLVALSAGPMRDALRTAAVDPDAARAQRAITTRIESVAVTALAEHDATASVTAGQARRWVDPVLGTSLEEDVRQLVTCRLVREDGRWLVAELRVQSEESARVGAR